MMESIHGLPSEQSQLLGVVRSVRLRYRAKRALRGAAVTVAASWILLALASYVMSRGGYADSVVLGCRIASLATMVALAAWFVVRPLLPRLRDEQIAMYLEEHESSLKASVITAVEMGETRAPTAPRSPALIDRLTRGALERVHRVNDGRAVDAGELRTNSAVLASVLAAAVLLTAFGPVVLRHGVRLITVPWGHGIPVSLFSIDVDPGNVTVAKGGDELIDASLHGFQSDRVDLLVRSADSTNWTRLPMAADSTGRYAFRLFDIGAKTEYIVEADGVRSPNYVIDVANLPYVKRMDLEYRYPSYTQLPPRDVDSSGDIAALQGTMVRIRVVPTVPTSGGRVVLDGGDTLRLVPTSDGRLMAMLRVDRSGFYKIELEGPQGRLVTGSLEYNIDALPDRPPAVQFTKPGRDQKVLSVDEVYTEARAEDDYGVAKLELVYSVNGSPERTMPLHEGTRAIQDISAGYTFMLENLKLQPGDVVSYYARATDNDAVSGAHHTSTDIYFLTVRPYDQDYRQQQGGGQQGGGGQQDSPGELSKQQRDIIAATFKTARDSAETDKKSLSENLATLRLSQQRLREQVAQLGSRLVERGIAGQDSSWAQIAKILPQAAAMMDTAEKKLADAQPSGALPQEQRALQQLQRAEAVFRNIQVSMGSSGGGGGGGQHTDAQDLADIFELQKDRLRNQYETVQRGQQQSEQQQQADNQVDETAEKLRELAARQQQENERAQRKADSLSRMGASGASGGQSQRDLAQQTEEEAHKLERLAREQQTPQSQAIAEAARRLQQAADAMRRSAANGKASSDASQALSELEQARRLLDEQKAGRSTRDLDDAARAAQQLSDQEHQVQSDVDKLQQDPANGAAAAQQRQVQQSIAGQKGVMADEVKALKDKLDRMALGTPRNQRDVSRAVEAVADTLRGRKVEEKLRYTQQMAPRAPADWMKSAEQQIASDIADLGQRVQLAQAAARTAAQADANQEKRAQAADRARDLVNGIESMNERLAERSEGSQSPNPQQKARGQQSKAAQGGEQGQQGQRPQSGEQSQAQRGQQGQQGLLGPNGQSGEQGQQGRPGQRGQSGQHGQPGQKGQGGQSGSNQRGGGRGQPGEGQLGGGGQPNGGGAPQGGMVPQGDGARLSPSDAQQFSREAQQRLADAEALRRDLAAQGLPTTELDRAIGDLRELTKPQVLDNARASADLRNATVEGFKDFEFALRRALGGGDSTRVLLERSGDVPTGYKQNVEEYYRSIGRGTVKQKP